MLDDRCVFLSRAGFRVFLEDGYAFGCALTQNGRSMDGGEDTVAECAFEFCQRTLAFTGLLIKEGGQDTGDLAFPALLCQPVDHRQDL